MTLRFFSFSFRSSVRDTPNTSVKRCCCAFQNSPPYFVHAKVLKDFFVRPQIPPVNGQAMHKRSAKVVLSPFKLQSSMLSTLTIRRYKSVQQVMDILKLFTRYKPVDKVMADRCQRESLELGVLNRAAGIIMPSSCSAS